MRRPTKREGGLLAAAATALLLTTEEPKFLEAPQGERTEMVSEDSEQVVVEGQQAQDLASMVEEVLHRGINVLGVNSLLVFMEGGLWVVEISEEDPEKEESLRNVRVFLDEVRKAMNEMQWNQFLERLGVQSEDSETTNEQ